MDKKVNLLNIYSIKNFVYCERFRKNIQEFFEKKTYTSKTNEYRPESENWLKSKKEDDRISNIPDHNIIMNYDNLVIEHSYHKVEFSIGTITVEINQYCYDTEEYVNEEHKLNFLVENGYWGFGLICSFEELINHHKVQSMFELMLDDQRQQNWQNRLKSTNNGVFMLLLDKILKSEKNSVEVNIYSSFNDNSNLWVQIGDQKYYMKDMLIINEAYKNDDYEFYDEQDKKIKYCQYRHESFPDFYLEHSKITQN